MPGPHPIAITLIEPERLALEAFVRRYATPQQQALRARVILAAAAGLNNVQIAQQFVCSVIFVRRWRMRWCASQAMSLDELPIADRLRDTPRVGRPARITPEHICHIVALACEAPSASGRPISHWSSTELAAEIMQRGIVDRISPRNAARLLKKGISSRTRSAIG